MARGRGRFRGDAHGGQLLLDAAVVVVVFVAGVAVVGVRVLVLVLKRALSPVATATVAWHLPHALVPSRAGGCWRSRFGSMVSMVFASTTAPHNPQQFGAWGGRRVKRRRVRIVGMVSVARRRAGVMQRRANVRHALDNERRGRLWAAAVGVVGWSEASKGLLPLERETRKDRRGHLHQGAPAVARVREVAAHRTARNRVFRTTDGGDHPTAVFFFPSEIRFFGATVCLMAYPAQIGSA